MGIYGAVIAVFLGYFIEIDYNTAIVKKMFLEKRTNRNFYEEYLHDDNISKTKKNICESFFEIFFRKQIKIDEE